MQWIGSQERNKTKLEIWQNFTRKEISCSDIFAVHTGLYIQHGLELQGNWIREVSELGQVSAQQQRRLSESRNSARDAEWAESGGSQLTAQRPAGYSTTCGTADMGNRAQVWDTGHRGQDPLCLLPCADPYALKDYTPSLLCTLTAMGEFFSSSCNSSTLQRLSEELGTERTQPCTTRLLSTWITEAQELEPRAHLCHR
jgi:hypothetical protein